MGKVIDSLSPEARKRVASWKQAINARLRSLTLTKIEIGLYFCLCRDEPEMQNRFQQFIAEEWAGDPAYSTVNKYIRICETYQDKSHVATRFGMTLAEFTCQDQFPAESRNEMIQKPDNFEKKKPGYKEVITNYEKLKVGEMNREEFHARVVELAVESPPLELEPIHRTSRIERCTTFDVKELERVFTKLKKYLRERWKGLKMEDIFPSYLDRNGRRWFVITPKKH